MCPAKTKRSSIGSIASRRRFARLSPCQNRLNRRPVFMVFFGLQAQFGPALAGGSLQRDPFYIVNAPFGQNPAKKKCQPEFKEEKKPN
jgi:hypothetical protein